MRRSYRILIILVICCSFFGEVLRSQQDAQYTQYMYNTMTINPAYAGSREALSIVGLHRSQWVGLDGAPRTQSLAFHSPFSQNSRIGLGVSIVNDALGPIDETYVDANFSYTIPIGVKRHLSFGLRGGFHLLNIDLMGLGQFNQGDPLFGADIDNKLSPQLGAGIYYRTDKFYVGASVPNLLETDHFDSDSLSSDSDGVSFLAEERMNYYLITGYVFDISDNLKFKPALLSKLVFGSPLQVDVSANFLIYNRLILGAAYRWSAAFSGMVGFQVSDTMLLGFSYDRETTELGNTDFNDGSYELTIRFELFKKFDRILTPRFF